MHKCSVTLQCLRGRKHVYAYIPQLKIVRSTVTDSPEKKMHVQDTSLTSAKPFEDIPQDIKLPFIGTLWRFLPIIGSYDIQKHHLALAAKRKKMGDIYREKFGPQEMVISFNADDGETLFRNEGPYPYRRELQCMKAYRESRKEFYSTTGIMVLQGKEWYDLRFKVQKHLMKPRAVLSYLNPMQEVARDFVEKVFRVRDSNKEVPELLGEINKWSLESVSFIGLDTRLGCLKTDLSPDSDGLKMMRSVQAQTEMMLKLEAFGANVFLREYIMYRTWKEFTKAADIFTEIAFKYINRALAEIKKVSNEDKDLTLLQLMLMTKGLDVSGAMVTVADMMLAGIDTTSSFVAFVLYHLARNPDKQELLYQEIKKLLPRKEDRITPNVFNELKYLKACMKESQRLHPVVIGTGRTLEHEAVFSGYRVPAGTMVILALQAIYRDKKYFTKPDQFLPERWLKKDEHFHPFAYLPFGFGTRSCVGRRLAELEILCLLTELVRNFRIEYHYEDIDIVIRLVNTPDKPLRFNFIER